jgi:alkylated DNA repair dioxygenase AlkB
MNAPACWQTELFDTAKSLPAGLVYFPDFITPEEETSLLAGIQKLPLREARYKQFTAKRRIVSFGAEYDFDKNRLTPSAPLPHFLFPLRDKVSDWLGIAAEEFAHALVSEYRPGTALGWHRDAPNFGIVAGVSLGEACRIRFRPYPPTKKREDVLVFSLHPRSAYVLRGNARWRWQHSIPMTKGLRYSITFRTLSGFSSFTRKET